MQAAVQAAEERVRAQAQRAEQLQVEEHSLNLGPVSPRYLPDISPIPPGGKAQPAARGLRPAPYAAMTP